MSMHSLALASLAVTYSDSDGEEDVDVDEETNSVPPPAAAPHNNQVGQPQGIVSPIFAKSASNSPTIPPVPQTNNLNAHVVNVLPKKVQRLVSYYDPDDSFVHHEEVTVIPDVNDASAAGTLALEEILGDELIPPAPEDQCPRELQEKISRLHMKMENGGLDMNHAIERRKDFKNPSIYSKLISFCSINELGTNYTPEQFDPFKWGQESFYDELAKAQEVTMERLVKKSKAKAEASGGAGKRPSALAAMDDSRRKVGKWDQVTTTAPATKPTVVTTTAVSDKKCKVIVAFGAIQKRRL